MSKQTEIKGIVDRLRNISLFNSIKDDVSLENMASILEIVHYSPGDNVVTEGDEKGDSLFIINKGTVEILKKTRHGDEYVVTDLKDDMNIFFGELALLDPDKRSATVRCKTECEFLKLTHNDFIKFGDFNPQIGLIITRELSKIVCQRNRKSNTDILTLFDALVEEVEISGGLS